MADTPQQFDPSALSKNMEFRNAPTAQKIAYLSSMDPEFAGAHPTEQAGYINHILGNDVETPFETSRKDAFKSEPDAEGNTHVRRDLLKYVVTNPRKVLNAAGTATKGLVSGVLNMPTNAAEAAVAGGRLGVQIGMEDTERKAENRSKLYRATAAIGTGIGVPARQMEEAADVGNPAGVVGAGLPLAAATVAPVAIRGVAKATLPARTALAQKIVQPLVYEGVSEAGADTRMGIQPERGIVKEGIWGTRGSMAKQTQNRLSLLKQVADKVLQTAPGAKGSLDAAGAINSAVDDAIGQAQRNGQSSIVPRLEELRQSLLTQHGHTFGSPFEINNLKTSIQDTASQLGAFKNTVPSEASAASAAGRASSNIRGQVNKAVPEAAPLNERMADLIDARSGLQRGMEAEKGKSIFGGKMEGTTSRVLNSTVGSPLVRSGTARLISLGAKADIPTPPNPMPPFPSGPVVGPQGNPTPFTGKSAGPMITPEQTPVPPTGPGNNPAVFPDIPTSQVPSVAHAGGEVPNWPPKVPDWSAPNTAPPIPSAESRIPTPTPYEPPPTMPELPPDVRQPINPQEVVDFERELRGMGYNGPVTADNINELMAKANEIRSASQKPRTDAAATIEARRKALKEQK